MIGGLISGFLSGAGNVKANYEAQGRKKELGWKIEDLQSLFGPTRDALVVGLQPGGYLRRTLAVPGVSDALSGGANFRQASGDTAYRYGGRGFGRAAGYMDRARRAPAEAVTASMGGDVSAADTLSRIDAAIWGADNAFPPTQPRNPYAPIGAGIGSFVEGIEGNGYSY